MDHGTPRADDFSCARVDTEGSHTEVEVATKEDARKITHGLDSFLLKPVGMKGEALFDQMIKFRKRNDKSDSNFKPSPMHHDLVLM